jgi:hypothetical protein
MSISKKDQKRMYNIELRKRELEKSKNPPPKNFNLVMSAFNICVHSH